MYKLNKPNIDQAKVIEDCLPRRKNNNTQRTDRIRGYLEEICNQVLEYDEKAQSGRLYLLKKIGTDEKSLLLKEDMVEYLYEQRFVGKGQKVIKPPYYSMLVANIDVCPFCGKAMGTSGFQLDHYLPKSLYPIFAVSPINLVPCCSACNRAKYEYAPENETAQLIHPYYDDFSSDTWIKAKLVASGSERNPEFTFKYYTDFPSNWPLEKKERAKTHIRILKLEKQFTVQSNIVLSHCKQIVSQLPPLKDQNQLVDIVKKNHNMVINTSVFGSKNGYYLVAWSALFENNAITNKYWNKMWKEYCQKKSSL